LTIFLHRFETNEPVKSAKLSVSAGEHELDAIAKDDGVFEVSAPWIGAAVDLAGRFMPPVVALSRRRRPRQRREFRPLCRKPDRQIDGVGGAGSSAPCRALLARPLAAEPRRHHAGVARGQRHCADRLLPGIGAVWKHCAGRCACSRRRYGLG
jgi:hypothetical protein